MIKKIALIDYSTSIPKGSIIEVSEEIYQDFEPDEKAWKECYYKSNRYLIDTETLERDFK